MKKLLFVLAGAVFGLATVFAQDYSDLIISEYLEGSSNNKALELYNGTGEAIDLSEYKLSKEINGEGRYSELALSGTLAAGATYVITNDNTNCLQEIRDLADLMESNNIMNFNGNDAVILYKGTTKIDVVGVEGSADNWGMDVTLRRKCGMGPNATYDASEWEVCEKDDYSDLGQHCGLDLSNPTVKNVSAASATSVTVLFSKIVTRASAETVANYAIEGLEISAAVLSEDEKTVTLTTSEMTDGTQYTLVVNNVEDANGNKVEDASFSFFYGDAELADLAALCALRATYDADQKYVIKGEVVITAIVGKNGSNQSVTNVWVQDKGCTTSVGHSMMLYAMQDKLPAGAKVGDVLTGLAGQLTVYYDLIEMQNIDAATLALTGETAEVVVDDVTIADLNGADKFDYQNAMVRIENVEFNEAGEVFEANVSYKLLGENNNIDLYTNREGDYLGQKIPLGAQDVICYVGYHNAPQVCIRAMSDIQPHSPLASEKAASISHAVYPNPTTGMVNVETEGFFNVDVYAVNGAQVLTLKGLNTSAQIDLSGLAKGLYMLQINAANGTVRTKVIVR